ncbi:MAG: hypothetical protein OXC99_02945 [Chloroflexi bacterium]|nr:hypothetical protein [Chloroflexota bacterium]
MTPQRWIISLVAVAALVAGVAGWLAFVLYGTQEDLQGTTATLTETRATLAATQISLAWIADALADERLVRNQLQRDKHALEEERADLTAALQTAHERGDALAVDLATVKDKNTVLTADLTVATAHNKVLTANLDAARDQNAGLTVDLTGALARESDLQAALEASTEQASSLAEEKALVEGNYAQLREEHSGLIAEVGTVESLKGQSHALRVEIAHLEEYRRPLILQPGDTYTTGFACTGSMEPLLTCLDSATWLSDFTPDDVVVGATITFPGARCWPGDTGHTAHRVIDVRTINGVREYLPKGDANDDADCWIPHSAVRDYIVEIHKNTRPANAELRDGVNTAKENYRQLRVRHGCSRSFSQTCYASGTAYTQLVRAYRAYQCWLSNARESRYPGHIPNPCL